MFILHRFSLYDFPSDSENEDQRPSSSAKKELKKVSNQTKPQYKKHFSGSTGSKKSILSSKISSKVGPKSSEEVSENNSGRNLFFDTIQLVQKIFLTWLAIMFPNMIDVKMTTLIDPDLDILCP